MCLNQEKWFLNYSLCQKYYNEMGNICIPNQYMIGDVNLGLWVYRQRKLYKAGKLSEEKVNLLNSLNMTWDFSSSTWFKMFELAKTFSLENGHLFVPSKYVTQGLELGGWISTQRKGYYSKGQHKLSLDRRELLEGIGMVWDANLSLWHTYYSAAQLFYNRFNHLYIPIKYKTDSGLPLGKWLSHQRYNYNKAIKNNTLSEIQERVEYLESIGIDWSINKQKNTSFGEQVLYFYLSQCFSDIENRFTGFGFELDIYIPSLSLAIEYDGYISHKDIKKDVKKQQLCEKHNISLINIRESRCPILQTGTIFEVEQDDFNSFEFVFNGILDYIKNRFNLCLDLDINIQRDARCIMDMYLLVSNYTWDKYFELAVSYFKCHNNLLIPATYESQGLKLGNWIRRQRQGYIFKNGNRLTNLQIQRLEEIHMVWNVRDNNWCVNLMLLYELFNSGYKLIPYTLEYKNVKLGYWWNRNYKKYLDGVLQGSKKEDIKEVILCYLTG